MKLTKNLGKVQLKIYKGTDIGVVKNHLMFTLKEDIIVIAKRFKRGKRWGGWDFWYNDLFCWIPKHMGQVVGSIQEKENESIGVA